MNAVKINHLIIYLLTMFSILAFFNIIFTDNKNYGLLFSFGVMASVSMALGIKVGQMPYIFSGIFLINWLDGILGWYLFLPVKSYDSIVYVSLTSLILSMPIILALLIKKLSRWK